MAALPRNKGARVWASFPDGGVKPFPLLSSIDETIFINGTMASKKLTFKDEGLVRKKGGQLAEYYYRFKGNVEYINFHLFDLFCELEVTGDINLIVEALTNRLEPLKEAYIEKTFKDIKAGKIPKYQFLSPYAQGRIKRLPPGNEEEKNKIWERETRLKISRTFEDYIGEYEIFLPSGLNTWYSVESLRIFGNSLFVTPERIEIDGVKFIELFTSYVEASESETGRLHEEAAEAVNRFFNDTKITQQELSRYFVLEHGRVKVKANSVNKEGYIRLGHRASTEGKGNEQKG